MDTVRLRIEIPGRPIKYRFIKVPDGADIYAYCAESIGWRGKKRDLYFDALWFLSSAYVVEIKRITEKDEL